MREERDAARQQEELARGEAARAAEGFASHQRDKHMLGRAVQLLQEEKLELQQRAEALDEQRAESSSEVAREHRAALQAQAQAEAAARDAHQLAEQAEM